jgi:DNA-binding GntR family transcriptional regulator
MELVPMSPQLALRYQVYQSVLKLIVEGQLAPGTRINESQLATELEVSRTPLREALFQLEQEGFVRSNLARGFVVEPLSSQELCELYPLIWTLEGFALRMSFPLVKATLPTLGRLNEQLANAHDDPSIAITIDTAWHNALLSHCRNSRLLAILDRLKLAAHRYEYLYMRDGSLITTSVVQHQNIIEAIGAGDIEEALQQLEVNWQFTMEFLLREGK